MTWDGSLVRSNHASPQEALRAVFKRSHCAHLNEQFTLSEGTLR